jgi:hypothetical protein
MRRLQPALSPEWSRTNFNAALAVLSIAGLVVRVAPLLRAGGPLAYPIDYDEGVYFSASALLFRGVFPYRDFVFVHPPGLLYALGLTATLSSAVGPAAAFAISRIVAAVIGAANIALAGRVAYRWAGPFAGLVAAGLYASYADVAVVENPVST